MSRPPARWYTQWSRYWHARTIPVPLVYSGIMAALIVVVFLAEHPGVLIVGGVIAAAGGCGWLYIGTQRHRARTAARTTVAEFRQLDPKSFEHAIARLCRRDGCRDVQVVGGAGDLAADVLATTPDGRRLLIQAKRYKPGNPVRSPALQAVNGTYRDVHRAHLAAVVTTSSFTADALKFGRQVGIRCFDNHALAAWASKTGPAPWQ